MQNPNPKKRLSLPTIFISIVCVFATIFGKDIASGVISIALTLSNAKLQLADIVFLLSNMDKFGLAVSALSASILAYYILRSRLKIDMPKTKRQVLVIGTIGGLCIVLISSIFVPLSLGNITTQNGTTKVYHLNTPLPIAQAYVGQYTNNSYFYINGATWANTLVSANKTLVEDTAIDSLTSGNVWSEVSFDYANLACPANITFTENVNGVERTFGNIANSQGSPYTISAGSGVDANNYFAEDRKGTIIFTSTNAVTILTQAAAVADNITLHYAKGNYLFPSSCLLDASVLGTSGITLEGEIGTVFKNNNAAVTYLINFKHYSSVTVKGIEFDGQRNSFNTQQTASLQFNDVDTVEVDNVDIHDFTMTPLWTTENCGKVTIENSKTHDIGWTGPLFYTGSGMDFDRGDFFTVRNCEIWNIMGNYSHAGQALYIMCSGLVEGNYIHDCYSQIDIKSYATIGYDINVEVCNNLIVNVPCVGSTYSDTIDCAQTSSIHDNIIIEGTSNTYGIVVGSGTGSQIYNNIINASGVGKYGVVVRGNANATVIKGNSIFDCQTFGIYMFETQTNTLVTNNLIKNAASWAIAPSAGNARIVYNTIESTSGYTIANGNTYIAGNIGYNPIGYIRYCFSGTNIVDKSGNATDIAFYTTYTNLGSAKTLYMIGGTISAVVINGQSMAPITNSSFVLQPGDTFRLGGSEVPAVYIYGQ